MTNAIGVHPLEALLGKIRLLKAQKPTVIFDLDSTLFCNTGRTFAIFEDYAKEHHPEYLALVPPIYPRTVAWGPELPFREAGADEIFLTGFRKYWDDNFFSNAYLDFDRPFPGAVRFVHEIVHAGASILYLTGRTVDAMGSGTRRSLLRSGFPLDDVDARLILKTDVRQPDIKFKAFQIAALKRTGVIAGLVEDMPAMVNQYQPLIPDSLIILMDTAHPPDAPAPDPSIPRIVDFLRPGELANPLLIILSGLPATGKSTAARIVAKALKAEHLSTDRARTELYPSDRYTREQKYTDEAKHRVYMHLFQTAHDLLLAGRNVVMDGMFLKKTREEAAILADQTGARLLFVKTTCSEEEARRRLTRRENQSDYFSEAFLNTYIEMKKGTERGDPAYLDIEADPLVAEKKNPLFVLDTGERTILSFNTQALPALREIFAVDFPLYRGIGDEFKNEPEP